jgi:hypothetical protein
MACNTTLCFEAGLSSGASMAAVNMACMPLWYIFAALLDAPLSRTFARMPAPPVYSSMAPSRPQNLGSGKAMISSFPKTSYSS